MITEAVRRYSNEFGSRSAIAWNRSEKREKRADIFRHTESSLSIDLYICKKDVRVCSVDRHRNFPRQLGQLDRAIELSSTSISPRDESPRPRDCYRSSSSSSCSFRPSRESPQRGKAELIALTVGSRRSTGEIPIRSTGSNGRKHYSAQTDRIHAPEGTAPIRETQDPEDAIRE